MKAAALFERLPDARAEWRECDKGAPRLIELADGHYTRQTPGSNQCCRPGMNFTLLLSDGMAGWVVWRPRPDVGRMDNLEAWENTLFRNIGPRLSSELVEEATALTFRAWGWPPKDGLISAIGVEQTRKRRSKKSPPGKCFLEAGWVPFAHPNPSPEKQWLRAPHPQRTPLPAPVAEPSPRLTREEIVRLLEAGAAVRKDIERQVAPMKRPPSSPSIKQEK